ncbi:hypothetical protein NL676_000885 [Syzygium grande]|nr:hypothetical protein NL676_000885 [Syzygium grande]
MDPLLYTAAKEGDVDKFIKALEDHCAKAGESLPVVLGQFSPSWNTLLHVAAESDDILRVVIDFVPDHLISWANSSGETPLHIAARAGQTGAVELLLAWAADPTVLDRSGNSPLHEAVRNCHYEVIRLLVSEDPNPLFHRNKESKSPWCVAIETGDLEVLKLLLEVSLEILPDPPVPDETVTPSSFGMPPAHVAILYRKMDMLTEMWNKMPVLLIRGRGGHERKGCSTSEEVNVDNFGICWNTKKRRISYL